MLRFGLHSGPVARGFAGTGALGVGERFGIGERLDIGGGQLVVALPASFQVCRQFVSGKDRTFLNADAVVTEDRNVRGDRDFLSRPSLHANVESINAGILSLVKA
jgi:hypothetical protein